MKYLLMTTLCLLISCSPHKQSPPTVDNYNASSPEEEGAQTSYSYGTNIRGSQIKDHLFVFKKSSQATEATYSTVSVSGSDFLVTSAVGCNRELVNQDKCYVRVRFLRSNSVGTYSSVLSVGTDGALATVSLDAAVIADPNLNSALSLREGGSEVSSVDFSLVNKRTSHIKSLEVKNVGSYSVVSPSVSVSGSGYSLIYNGCGATLRVGASCYVRLKFLADQGSGSDELREGVISVSGIDTPIQATIRGVNLVVGSPDVKFYESSLEVTTLDFGTLASGRVQKVVLIKNEGTADNEGSLDLVGDSNLSISSHSCSSVLKAGDSCQARISFSFTDDDGAKAASLSLGNFSLALTANIYAPSVNFWGLGTDGILNTPADTSLCDNTEDGDMCVRQYQSLTINEGHVLTTAVRRRGLMIYVQGDLIVNGTLSMKARGAMGDPSLVGVGSTGLTLYRKKTGGSQSGTSDLSGAGSEAMSVESSQGSVSGGIKINLPREGGLGGVRQENALGFNQGADGVNGQSGGGSSGGLYLNGGYGASGAGAAGTVFSGGSGGGGNFSDMIFGDICGDAEAFGGAGGFGCGNHPFHAGGGGAGNPGGAPGQSGYRGEGPHPGETGTGGLLILVVKGNIIVGANGKITTEGSSGGFALGGGVGGASGGGPLVLIYGGNISNSGIIWAAGGRTRLNDAGTDYRPAGAGSVISEKVSK